MKLLKWFLPILVFLSVLVIVDEEAEASDSLSVLDYSEIQDRFDSYIADNGLNADLISVGYRYLETGETWYHNKDRWYYSASLYKVPLMMILAEKESAGELDSESLIYNWKLADIEEEVLVYSNNDIAYSMLLYVGEPNETRKMFQRYSSLTEDDYPWTFYGSSFFSVPFMTDVMTTLYQEPERFPRIAELLTLAQPNHYFRRNLEERGPEIAQKYGSYHDQEENDWNHAAGIFYTAHPFVLTVMTRYGGISEIILGDLAELFYEYSAEVDINFENLIAEKERTERSFQQDISDIDSSQESSSSQQTEQQSERDMDESPQPEPPFLILQEEKGTGEEILTETAEENYSGRMIAILVIGCLLAGTGIFAVIVLIQSNHHLRRR